MQPKKTAFKKVAAQRVRGYIVSQYVSANREFSKILAFISIKHTALPYGI